MNLVLKLFYKLTFFWPRKLPRNQREWELLKTVVIDVYGVEDNEKTLLTLIGNCQSTPPNKSRRSWYELAVIAKRLKVNSLMQDEKQKIISSLEEKLKIEFEKLATEEKAKAVAPSTIEAALDAPEKTAVS